MATVSGIVRDSSNALVQRLVRLHDRKTGALLGQTLSNATTGAYSFTVSSTGEVYVVAHDTADADPYWNSVVLAMHMDDTGLTDVNGKTVTLNGGAARSATQSKFGGYSAYFDGTGDYLSLADSVNFELGSSDFTIDAWVFLTGYAASYGGTYNSVIVGKDASGDRGWFFTLTGTSSSWTGFQLGLSDGSGTEYLNVTTSLSLNTWYHVEVTRSGNSVRFFRDGTQQGATQTATKTVRDSSTSLSVGRINYTSYEYYLTGYIDDLRITKGVARHTADFTAPTAAFVDGISGGDANAVILDRLVPA